ncbi:hypothetical protein [Anaerovorax sp. IOR16]|uniref:hypothetical protein n=1 Tax=Anaerovorax sp. IOR16 TaxID=2773458 RepID=UPI0019D0FE61|nr:hypothetical protein [Anaerovorax sp. IOR16]
MDRKLIIGIISYDLRRSVSILDSIARMETETVKINELSGFVETRNAIYQIIPNLETSIKGKRVDQLIWDFALPIDNAYHMLLHSYIPEQFQIIDDRIFLGC